VNKKMNSYKMIQRVKDVKKKRVLSIMSENEVLWPLSWTITRQEL